MKSILLQETRLRVGTTTATPSTNPSTPHPPSFCCDAQGKQDHANRPAKARQADEPERNSSRATRPRTEAAMSGITIESTYCDHDEKGRACALVRFPRQHPHHAQRHARQPQHPPTNETAIAYAPQGLPRQPNLQTKDEMLEEDCHEDLGLKIPVKLALKGARGKGKQARVAHHRDRAHHPQHRQPGADALQRTLPVE